MLYLSWCSKAVELKKQFYIMDIERATPPPLAWSASSLTPLAPLTGLQQACPLFWGSTGLNRSLLVPTAPGIKHRAPRLPLRIKKGALAEIALHKEKHGKWLPPSVWSNHHAVPPHWDLGFCPFFPHFLFASFFPQIFMKRFSIYPGASSPPWVSAGRAQTTNSRRYFPQSSSCLSWQM